MEEERVRTEVVELLHHRPEIEDDLRAILAVDAEQETWTFDDIPVDSGTFGELVSRGIVEQADSGYLVTAPEVVQRTLDGTPVPEQTPGTDTGDTVTIPTLSSLTSAIRNIDRRWISGLVILLTLVVGMRVVFTWSTVMRGDDIVLLGNDPYFYRYHVEQLLQTDTSISTVGTGEPLLIVILATAATLLGGGEYVIGLVVAWYPVGAAVLSGLLVAAMGYLAFSDRRVALAGLAFFAMTPLIIYRSGLGFGDHHAFDYFLVTLTITSLLALVTAREPWPTVTPKRIAGAIGLAVGVAAHVHAWEGGPLLILPIGVYIVVKTAIDVSAGHDPLRANSWMLAALLFGAMLTYIIEGVFGWAGTYRTLTPLVLALGSITISAIGTLGLRYRLRPAVVIGAELSGIALFVAGVWTVLPAVRRGLLSGLGFISRTNQSTIVETQSLLSNLAGTTLFQFGLPFYLGLIVLVWLAWRAWTHTRPAWLVLAVYTASFLAASLVQIRFAGHLAISMTVIAGFGFIYLLAVVNVVPSPMPISERSASQPTESDQSVTLPDRKTSLTLIGIFFVLLAGLNLIFVPELTESIAVTDDQYQTAVAIDDHAAAANVSWPNNYVLSRWDHARFYNYHVNGEASSYQYARANYAQFLLATQPAQQYQTLQQKPVGYVVVNRNNNDVPPQTMQARLWHWGSYTNGVPGVGHYRVIYASDTMRVHQLVPGAILVGTASPNTTTTVETTVTANNNTHSYQRQATTTETGLFSVRVPYAGTYEVEDTQISVSETAVTSGETVTGPTVTQRPSELPTDIP